MTTKSKLRKEFYWRWWTFTLVEGDRFDSEVYYQNDDQTWFCYPTVFGWVAGPEEHMLWMFVGSDDPLDALGNYAAATRWAADGRADVEKMKAIHADLERRLLTTKPEETVL
jgi:hypothetical protein